MAAAMLVTGGGLLVAAATAWAQTAPTNGCSQYATYTALGEAEGVQTVVAAPGATLTDTVDGELPGAQAELDSLLGSNGWAGAPYSSVVAGNVGQGNVNPNQVPVFAVSSYPSQPTAKNSSPAGTLEAQSSADSSSAQATSGGPSTSQATAGRVTVSASATCAADGTLQGSASSTANAFDLAGVFEIGAVTSHATAVMSPTGQSTLSGTTTIAGATVLGQAVQITNQGLELPGSTVALPSNPLSQALANAGISVQYLALTKEPNTGTVLAPGVAITVTEHLAPGVGQGVETVTYVLGRATATAIETGGSAPTTTMTSAGSTTPAGAGPAPTSGGTATPTGSSGGTVSTGPATSPAATTSAPANSSTPSAVASAAPEGSAASPSASPVSYLANASAESFYAVVAIGSGLLLAALVLFGVFGVRLRWR